jgi:hypothetical protein
MFLGVCRMHRAQLLLLRGDWNRAEAAAIQVCDDLADINVLAVSESHYQIGEIKRLRGDLPGARRRTAQRMNSAVIPNPVWHWCGWLKVGSMLRCHRSGQSRFD